uniref:Putative glycoside hydrolase n=1 Tax=viral metagenome TaxID=1070528 RepID=A0A6M3KTN5_9ZZZZ
MRAQGIDFSKHQWGYEATVKAHDFAMVRASIGWVTDIRFTQHVESIVDVPVRMAYHYFRSLGISDPLFWRRQADHYLETVYPYCLDAYVLDFERANNLPSVRFGSGARQWIDYVAEETGKFVILYINPASYQEYLLQYGQTWMNDYPLWVAQYPYKGWNDKLQGVYDGTWQPRLPAGHKEWKFWQFSADGNRKGTENGLVKKSWELTPSVDLDVYNGSLAEMKEWLGMGAPVPEPPPTPPEPPTPAPVPPVQIGTVAWKGDKLSININVGLGE